jgi:hypothetical protein
MRQFRGSIPNITSTAVLPAVIVVSLAREALAGEPPNPADVRGALARYGGDLLPTDLYEEWTQRRRDAMRETFLDLLREMLALSKMNWNTADFSCEEPITLAFARKVGPILAEIPRDIQPQPEYRFYM